MRELLDEEIRATNLHGRILDVGGGDAASYRPFLRASGEIKSVNIDPAMRPTTIGDLAQPLPFADQTFDTVISFNTLEHLANDQFALEEMVRVLVPGGLLFILVPFLYRMHGHPDDYHRHTSSGWNVMLNRAGIPSSHPRITPLLWDPLSSAWSIAALAPLGRTWWRLRRYLRPVVLASAMWRRVDPRVSDVDAAVADYPLAYRIIGRRPELG
jgi:SAM-dependent methyltransferase